MYPIVSRSQPAHRDENDHRIELYCVNEAIVLRALLLQMKGLTSRHTHIERHRNCEIRNAASERAQPTVALYRRVHGMQRYWRRVAASRKVGQHEPNERLKASEIRITIAEYASIYFWIWRSHCGRRFHSEELRAFRRGFASSDAARNAASRTQMLRVPCCKMPTSHWAANIAMRI